MSNIYIQEPPTHGKVLLKTSVGDIDLELWSKEAPKACRNFIQLCMEGYYDGTIFHRVVKGFIAQGGDPTGTGTGGESIYGKPFKDEIHSRLRFNRRGLVAMANAGRDDNGSQFFFTLAATSELQGKHTIFAKVTGETVFNMIKLEDTLVDQEDRPLYPQKVLKSEVLNNPFPDIIPRGELQQSPGKEDKKKKDKKAGVKNYKLLSFGSEAEEDDEETVEANRKYVGKSKSQHDLALDPKLSSEPAVSNATNLSTSNGESSDSDHAREQVERVRNRLKKFKKKPELDEPIVEKDDDGEEEYEFGKERREEKERKVEELRKEIRDLKRGMQSSKAKTDQKQDTTKDNPKHTDTTVVQYKEEIEKYRTLKQEMPKKGGTREEITLALLAKFQKKLRAAKEKQTQESEVPITKSDDEESDDWLSHKLEFEEKMPILAKDASTKSDEWFEMTDPRNPINKRRREASKALLESKEKRTRH